MIIYRDSVSRIHSAFHSYLYDIERFLVREFFTLDEVSFKILSDTYRSCYGQGAYNYLLKTYDQWKIGVIRPNNVTLNRILQCLPKLLTTDKQYRLIKMNIQHYLQGFNHRMNYADSLACVRSIFNDLLCFIDKFSVRDLTWYLRGMMYSQDDLNDIVNLCKSSQYQLTNIVYNNVVKDVSIVSESLGEFSKNKYHAVFNIPFIKLRFTVHSYDNVESLYGLNIPSVDTSSILCQQATRSILEELVHNHQVEVKGASRQILNRSEFYSFISSYRLAVKSADEGEIHAEFCGEGGVFSISIQIKSLKRLWVDFAYKAVYTTVIIAVTLVIASIMVKRNLAIDQEISLKIMVIVGLIITVAALVIKSIISEAVEILKEIKKHDS